ncbi:MAG: VanZ family protein [Chitinophagaceae bacterium]
MKKIFSTIFPALAWTILIQIALCLPGEAIPSTEGFPIPNFDKIVHVIIFGGFVGLWSYYLSRKTNYLKTLNTGLFLIYLLAVINGIAIEYIQRDYIPNRSFDQGDIIADVLSASIAYGICNIVLGRRVSQVFGGTKIGG